MWRAQLQACLLADPREADARFLLDNSKTLGPPADRRYVVDVEHFDTLLRDAAPFCERISLWSGQPAMRFRLGPGRNQCLEARLEHCDAPGHWLPREVSQANLTSLLRKSPPRGGSAPLRGL